MCATSAGGRSLPLMPRKHHCDPWRLRLPLCLHKGNMRSCMHRLQGTLSCLFRCTFYQFTVLHRFTRQQCRTESLLARRYGSCRMFKTHTSYLTLQIDVQLEFIDVVAGLRAPSSASQYIRTGSGNKVSRSGSLPSPMHIECEDHWRAYCGADAAHRSLRRGMEPSH